MSVTHKLLPQISFAIMMALALKPRHGYEIVKQVEADSLGMISLGPGALYTTIKKLIGDGLLEEIAGDGNQRRRYYRLTRAGWDYLDADVDYYAAVMESARQRLGPKWSQ